METEARPEELRHYVPTPGGTTVEVSRNSNGTSSTDYLLTDHLGSTDAVLDGTGGFVLQASFDTFGKRRGSDWSAATPPEWTAIAQTTRVGYTGQEMVDNVGLVHLNGRVYDPAIGRFLSVDPLIGDLADSQSVNPYAYVGNRPLTFSDPTGYCLEAPGNISCTAASFLSQNYGKAVLDLAVDVLVMSGVFGSSGHQPPPATVLPGQSAQRGTGLCGPGNTTPTCGGMILYASGPGTASGVPSSSWITSNDPYARENVEQLFIDIFNNSVDVLILGAYYDAKGAYEAVEQGNYGTAVVYVAFTVCDVAEGCKGLTGLKTIGRLAGLRKVERATEAAARGQIHHIATDKAIKSGFTEKFQQIFERAGKSLQDPANKVFLEGHAGRHSPAYHQYVLDRLQNATRGLSGDAYTRALEGELRVLRGELLTNPDLVRGVGL